MRDTKNGRSDAKPTPYLDYAEQLFGNGFTPLPADGKAVKLKGWREFQLPSDEAKRTNFIDKNKYKNIGIRTGEVLAIDNDSDDPTEARRIRQIVFDICGPTPFIRQGRYPREVYLYSMATPVPKIEVGDVEILGDGQQVIIHGVHPLTQKPYVWHHASLLDATLEDLPQLELEALYDFVEAIGGQIRTALSPKLSSQQDSAPVAFQGARNNTLFKFLVGIALDTASHEDLLSRGIAFNNKCEPPDEIRKVHDTVKSVWRKKERGEIYPPNEQFSSISRRAFDQLSPRGLYLYHHLKFTRGTAEFGVAQGATAKYLKWGVKQLREALQELLESGLLVLVRKRAVPNRPKPEHIYRLG